MASSTIPPTAPTFDQLRPQVEDALTHYHNADDRTQPFADLHAFRHACRQPHRSLHQVTNRILDHCWERLQALWADDADFIEKRFLDRETMQSIALKKNVSEGYVYTLRNRALDRMTTALLAHEAEVRAEEQRRWLARLDTATYTQLFGVDEVRRRLYDALTQAGPPWLIQLEAIGGSGKSSLADAVTRDLIAAGAFADIGWVSVQPMALTPLGDLVARSPVAPTLDGLLQALVRQLLPNFPLSPQSGSEQLMAALHEQLKDQPHLIVIDNVEMIEDLAPLAALLERLANPSRFLLTTRVTLPTMHPLFRLPVPPLARADAFALLRHEAGWGNLPAVATADAATLAPIYAAVGGNPLALRLVVGLAHHHALATIVERLQQSNDTQIDQLYRFLFAQSWQALDKAERRLLLYMPLVPSRGEEIAWIAAATGRDEAAVTSDMEQLLKLNLVNVHRDSTPFRYSIHQVTRTFLLNDAIHWRS
ncbi:MAG: NB-ARC domain-containing protein [Caldilineaceae bacterium]